MDTLDLGSRDAEDKTLQRMVASNELRPIDRGLYDQPRGNTLTGQPAAPEDRRGLFLATANRLGTPLQNVEKDFWVSWVPDFAEVTQATRQLELAINQGTQ